MAPVKTRDRQWYDVGIFKNNSAVVSQFYLLPEETLSISNKVAANSSLTYLHIHTLESVAHMVDNKKCDFLTLQQDLVLIGVLYFVTVLFFLYFAYLFFTIS